MALRLIQWLGLSVFLAVLSGRVAQAQALHVPEPMVFDLVRGLGAGSGELESNVLALVQPGRPQVAWAPEVEWAFAKGHAIELELPLVDRRLQAFKLALQGTLPGPVRAPVSHGWQGSVEALLDNGQIHATGLYLLAWRISPHLSALTMTGLSATTSTRHAVEPAVLVNPSLFYEQGRSRTWGLEGNFALDLRGSWRTRLLPQGHFQLGRHVRLQLAVGVELQAHHWAPLCGLRLVQEL